MAIKKSSLQINLLVKLANLALVTPACLIIIKYDLSALK